MPGIHGCLCKLVRVHLPQTLVPLRLLEPDSLLREFRGLTLVFPVGVGVDVLLHAALRVDQLKPVQRRNRRIHPPCLDQGTHVSEEQGGEQTADMRPVRVGIGHEDDLPIAGRIHLEGTPGACADHLDDGGAFSILEHVADRGLLHVQNLAADRQQRLELGVAGVLGGAERRVPLDDEQLAQVAVSASAVFQFRGQCR